MSQVVAARSLARPATNPSTRTTPTPRPHDRDLRVVTAPRAAHGGLLVVCLALLVAALLGVLLLNIAMAKNTFALGELQRESSELADTAAETQHALEQDTAPAALAQRALDLAQDLVLLLDEMVVGDQRRRARGFEHEAITGRGKPRIQRYVTGACDERA